MTTALMPKKSVRDNELHIRLTKDEINNLKKIASRKGLPLSTWARMTLVEASNEILGN